jgi:hypothetical protein
MHIGFWSSRAITAGGCRIGCTRYRRSRFAWRIDAVFKRATGIRFCICISPYLRFLVDRIQQVPSGSLVSQLERSIDPLLRHHDSHPQTTAAVNNVSSQLDQGFGDPSFRVVALALAWIFRSLRAGCPRSSSDGGTAAQFGQGHAVIHATFMSDRQVTITNAIKGGQR